MKQVSSIPNELTSSESTPLQKKSRADLVRERVNKMNQENNEKERNFKIFIACSFLCLVLLVVGIIFWIKHDYEEREIIDTRKVWISYPSIDHSVDPPQKYNCTNIEPCEVTCLFLKQNLLEEKKACEYQDYLHIFRIILEILLVIGAIQCICGAKKKEGS